MSKCNPHPTKKGPGRRHKEIAHPGHIVASAGAPRAFRLHTNAHKNSLRKMKAQVGARQFRRATRPAYALA